MALFRAVRNEFRGVWGFEVRLHAIYEQFIKRKFLSPSPSGKSLIVSDYHGTWVLDVAVRLNLISSSVHRRFCRSQVALRVGCSLISIVEGTFLSRSSTWTHNKARVHRAFW